MQKIRIDFDNPGLPQHISAVENDSQSRFFQATLYENGKAYTAPAGASYSIMYRGFGPQNQGWYDTINDGAGKRAACTASGNVVTCEIARQALQVPGHVSVVLCVTTGKGYMLKSWPIECDCKNDRYDSTVEIQSFFYITQVSNADWTQAIQAVEELKNTIDPTLSLSGKAADAKVTGDAVGQVKEDLESLEISINLDIERGQINLSGENVNETAKTMIRTKEYIPTTYIDEIHVVGAMLYYKYYSYIDGAYKLESHGNTTKFVSVNKEYGYIRAYMTTYPDVKEISISDWPLYIKAIKNIPRIKEIEDSLERLKSISLIAPKTEKLTFNLKDNAISTNGMLAGSSNVIKTVTLSDVKLGDRYRIKMNDGYIVRTAYYDTTLGLAQLYNICQRMVDIVVTPYNTGVFTDGINIAFKKADNSEWTEEDVNKMGLTIEKVLWKNKSGEYDMIVAASDADESDKLCADLVCDGVNDEIEIECAANCNITCGHNAKILLVGKTFNIDSFTQVYINSGEVGGGNDAICIKKSSLAETSLLGFYYPYDVSLYGKGRRETRIKISKDCYSRLDENKEYSLIGAIRSSGEYMGEYVLTMGLTLAGIGIYNNLPEKPVCMIDGIGFTTLLVEDCYIGMYGVKSPLLTYDRYNFVNGSIGIRLVHGSNQGVKASVKHTMISGYKEGMAILGEHILCEDVAMLRCYYGFTVGNYNVTPKMEHPIVMIGCGVGKAYQYALLNRYGASETGEVTKQSEMQTLIYVGGSTEPDWTDAKGVVHQTLPIEERIKGAYRGRFETDWLNSSPFFSNGSGKNIEKINSSRKNYGTLSSDRPSYSTMDEGAKFLDTENNKLYYIINGKWVSIN